jgi:hypothetical protein
MHTFSGFYLINFRSSRGASLMQRRCFCFFAANIRYGGLQQFRFAEPNQKRRLTHELVEKVECFYAVLNKVCHSPQ